MAIADDFEVTISGDIRYTQASPGYSVLDLYRYLRHLEEMRRLAARVRALKWRAKREAKRRRRRRKANRARKG